MDTVLTDVPAGLNHSLEQINDLNLYQRDEARQAETIAELYHRQTLSYLEGWYTVSVEVLKQDVKGSQLYSRKGDLKME